MNANEHKDVPLSQASTGKGSSFQCTENDNIESMIALIRLTQDQGSCSAFKDCEETLIAEIATIFAKAGLQGKGKNCIEEVLDCVDISLFDLKECSASRVLLTQGIAQLIKLANQPNRLSEPQEAQNKVATNLERLVNTLNKEKEVVHIDIQRELKNNCGNWHEHSKGLWPKGA